MEHQSEPYSILIADDDPGNLESLSKIFQREGFRVSLASGGKEALEQFRKNPTELVLCDLMMPELNGMELLKGIKAVSPHTQVIMITAYGTIDRAVEAMRAGAWDFITKPFKRRELIRSVQKALKTSLLLRENRALRRQLEALRENQTHLIGQSPSWRRILEIVKQVAPSNATVLLQGESGTGKELLAREIHRLSPRRQNRFVAVNCGAFPETLFDSEMFGYEKGAFTGALQSKPGRFELADSGTLFLDEIAELPPSLQVKLLRVLQDRRVERLGSTVSREVDIRLIAATNKDLASEVAAGRFREDLFYRLNVIKLEVPPLRERREDIPLLAQYFLSKYGGQAGRPELRLAPETIEILQNYHWPGNVRELKNAMERAAILASENVVSPSDLPPEIYNSPVQGNFFVIPFGTPLEEIEKIAIRETLKRCDGDKKLAAQLLGIAVRTIYRKLDAIQSSSPDAERSNDKSVGFDDNSVSDKENKHRVKS